MTGTSVGLAVGTGVDVLLVDASVVAVTVAVGEAVACGRAVAVADDPQAKIKASRMANGPRMIAFGFFNQ